jgi:hypothetical protein
VLPLILDTASTGITGPSWVPQMSRARMNCEGRSPGLSSIFAFASTVCVASSTWGETKLMRVSARTAPAPSRIWTGWSTRSRGARSTGTET